MLDCAKPNCHSVAFSEASLHDLRNGTIVRDISILMGVQFMKIVKLLQKHLVYQVNYFQFIRYPKIINI